jgi:hypothetical protein
MQCLHLLGIAKTANIDFTLEDVTRINDKTPVLADLKAKRKIFNGRCFCNGWRTCCYEISFRKRYYYMAIV